MGFNRNVLMFALHFGLPYTLVQTPFVVSGYMIARHEEECVRKYIAQGMLRQDFNSEDPSFLEKIIFLPTIKSI